MYLLRSTRQEAVTRASPISFDLTNQLIVSPPAERLCSPGVCLAFRQFARRANNSVISLGITALARKQ